MDIEFHKKLIESILNAFLVLQNTGSRTIWVTNETFAVFTQSEEFYEKYNGMFTGKDIRASIDYVLREDKKWLDDTLNEHIKNKTKYSCDHADDFLIYFEEKCNILIYQDTMAEGLGGRKIRATTYCYMVNELKL